MSRYRIQRRGRRYYPQRRRFRWWPFRLLPTWAFFYREDHRIGFASKQAAQIFIDGLRQTS